jgi:sensor c-di-GMP phosphodiesterase-like protein
VQRYRLTIRPGYGSLVLAVLFAVFVPLSGVLTVAYWQSDWKSWLYQFVLFSLLALLTSGLLVVWIIGYWRHDMSMEFELGRALKKRDFRVVYQPILHKETGQCLGVEALLRWEHPEKGTIVPDVFIPVAARSGAILPLTLWLFDQLQHDLQYWLHRNPNIFLSINVVAAHFQDRWIEAAFKHLGGIRPQQIVFEISESEAFFQLPDVQQTIEQLRSRGYRLGIDDFGTGYTNLNQLREAHFDLLKIDKVFVHGIGDQSHSSLVDHLVQMGQTMNLMIVAGGVETSFQAVYLQRLGVKAMQGWYFSEPLAAAELIKRFNAKTLLDLT